MHFLTTLFEPVVLAFIAACCFFGYLPPGYRDRVSPVVIWIVFLGIGVFALIGLIMHYVV